ncbi:MAG: hypothetical protein MZV63_72080 [Marinilabiliales bacterium]|nr:hypothetical protein [Marinilabiliales bacterium]
MGDWNALTRRSSNGERFLGHLSKCSGMGGGVPWRTTSSINARTRSRVCLPPKISSSGMVLCAARRPPIRRALGDDRGGCV